MKVRYRTDKDGVARITLEVTVYDLDCLVVGKVTTELQGTAILLKDKWNKMAKVCYAWEETE